MQGPTFSFLAPTISVLSLPVWKCPFNETHFTGKYIRNMFMMASACYMFGSLFIHSFIHSFILFYLFLSHNKGFFSFFMQQSIFYMLNTENSNNISIRVAQVREQLSILYQSNIM